MDLHDALDQISDIRHHLVRTGVFRGYRSATTAFTALVAVVTAIIHAQCLADDQRATILALWLAAALISVLVVGVEMAGRCILRGDALQRQATVAAVSQFIPCLVAGALITLIIDAYAASAFWMLPGLWAILFAMGVFASRPMLPRAMTLVGGFYLLAGLCALVWSHETKDFSPAVMGITFGIGQSLAAAVLYASLERRGSAAGGEDA